MLKYGTTIQSLNENIHALSGALNTTTWYTIPHIGDYKYSARSEDFHGWMVCDGRSLNTSNYQGLYEIIGTNFGGSNGTFKLPNCQGRSVAAVGQASSNEPLRSLGEADGYTTHILTSNEMPTHTHTAYSASNGVHNHGGITGNASHAGAQGIAALGGGNDVAEDGGFHNHSIANDGLHAHTITVNNTGGSQPHNNLPPTLYIGNLFIFAGTREYGYDPAVMSL